MKKLIFFLLLVISFSSFALDVYLPKAPPSLPLAKSPKNIKDLNLKYYNDVVTEVIPNIIKNEDALYVIPVNNGAQLYNKGKDLKLIAVLSEGLLSIVSSKNYANLKSLDKEEIYIGGQGSSPDTISNYLFKKNKIKPSIKYRSSTEIAKLIMTNQITTAVLPEPQASMVLDKNKNLKRVFILKNEWKKANGQNSIPQVAIFASQSVINKNKNLINTLAKEYKNSLVWMNKNKNEAAKFGIEVFQVALSETAFENSIDNMNLVYIEGLVAKKSVDTYLNALKSIDANAMSKIPGADFYKK